MNRDIRHALRNMWKNPLFAVTSILILALGIGGNTAMFTVIRAVLLKPLEYRDPDGLVRLAGGATPARFEEMKTARSVTALAAYTGPENLALGGGEEPEVVKGVHVSATFLDTLGVHPALGRGFLPEEDTAGGAPAAMISSELWQRRFAADPGIIGKTAILTAAPYTIIGVLPPRFQFPFPGMDVWLTAPPEWPAMSPQSRPLSPFLTAVARLKPGVTLEQANAEMKVIRQQYAAAHPAMLDAKPKTPLEVTAMKEELVASVRAMLWLLFGAVGFVLLIACANVASLLLARASARSREFAVRAALGAARTRLIRQLLAESVLLSLAGGSIGVLLAALSLRAIPLINAIDLPRAAEIRLGWTVLAFAATLSVGTGVFFGLAPALGASRPDLIRILRAAGEDSNKSGRRFSSRGLLVVGQVALSVVLLIGAALLLESVSRLRGIDAGFNPSNLLTVQVSLPLSRYDTDLKKKTFFRELAERVALSPGVRGASVASYLPMMSFAGTPIQDAAQPPLKLNERPIATIMNVGPGYFRTLEIAMRRGREFTESDKDGAQRVAIIDESTANHFWPGQDPIGKHLLVGGVNQQPAEVVGVVADIHQVLDEKNLWPYTVYGSFAQLPSSSAMLAVRTAGDPLGFVRTVRNELHALDRDQPIALARSMDGWMEIQVGQRRLILFLLGSFAGVALLLALIGIYGVIAYSVAQRTQEMGIRRALGAEQSDILRLVLGQGSVLVLVGVAIGVAGAFALTRVMKTLLFHVSATDPLTFAGIAALFFLVALAASYIPARRAARIDPMAALRA